MDSLRPRRHLIAASGGGRRVLLAIHNAYTDATSGAARSVRTLVEWLAAAGHDCRVLATARFDAGPSNQIDQHLAELDIPINPVHPTPACAAEAPAVQFTLAGVPVTMLLTRAHRIDQPDPVESQQWLNLLDRELDRFAPDLLVTYGGHPVVQEAMRRARSRGVVTLFTLRNRGYEDRRLFDHADHVLTPSPCLSRFYRDEIGLESTGIESPIAWSEVLAGSDSREFVTFVNPALHKGAALFARLADVLGTERPDIPILIVFSGGDGGVLKRFRELDLGKYPQIVAGPPTRRPADFLALTKLLLVPSVCEESFGRVPVEAMINGIPPLVSNRGALPETVRGAGRVLPVPDWMTPTSVRLPSVEEVRPWCRAICELWDDRAAYRRAAASARRTAEQFYAEPVLKQRYMDYFDSLLPACPLYPPGDRHEIETSPWSPFQQTCPSRAVPLAT